MKDNNKKFDRFIKLINKSSFNKLSKKKVLVLGIGGVGGYVVESLVRSGISSIIIVDYDKPWLVIIVVNVYMFFGSTMVIMISAIMGIDVEIFEAAEIDGATRMQTFFKVTLPCMRQMLIYMLVMSVIGGLNLYEVPAMLIGIGCNNAGLTNLMYIQNQAFSGSYIYNRAAAASVILALLCVGLSCIIFFILRDKDEVKIKKLRRAAKREERRRLAAI